VVQVEAVAPSGTIASFDIGVLRTGVPMVEVEKLPDADEALGVFRGAYVVQRGDRAEVAVIRVRAIGVGAPSEPLKIEKTPVEIRG
jgi:hypothetical protein